MSTWSCWAFPLIDTKPLFPPSPLGPSDLWTLERYYNCHSLASHSPALLATLGHLSTQCGSGADPSGLKLHALR
jgi:hypothetical protein